MSFWEDVNVGPEGWQPNPGDQLEGTVRKLDFAQGAQFGDYPIIVLETTDGEEVALHAFHGRLKRALKEKSPEVGNQIRVKYLGKRDRTHEYEVEVGKELPF